LLCSENEYIKFSSHGASPQQPSSCTLKTQKTEQMSKTVHTKTKNEDKLFLPLIRHPPCYSYVQKTYFTPLCAKNT